ncbi:MAG TPA: acyltransferase family protein [Syntrophomonas sp.]|nr:acyltransferase family protein [Syntrophomonas sp.]
MRNPMFDVLKGLGIISVVFSHVYRGGTDPLAVFIREVAMWSVPMFFIVQGHFMQSGLQKGWLTSSWDKIKKSYVPYLYWAVAYGAFYYFTIGKTFSAMDLILGKTALHLYYMFYYIIFAVFMPLLYFLPKLWRVAILWLMILVNIYWVLMLELSRLYHFHWISYSGPVPMKWWGFIAIGMLVAEYPQIKEYICQHARAFLIGGLAVAAVGTIIPYINHTTGYLFNKVEIFPLSIGLVLALAIYYSRDDAFGKQTLAYIGERTFGIYLAHFFMVDYLRQTLLPGDRTLVVIIILVICILVKDNKDRIKAAWKEKRSGKQNVA